MSGYPPPDLSSGFPVNQPPYSVGDNPTGYPPYTGAPPPPGILPNPSYPYPYPYPDQPSTMNPYTGGPPSNPPPANPYAGGPPSNPPPTNPYTGGPPTNPYTGGPPSNPPPTNPYTGGPPTNPYTGGQPQGGVLPAVCPSAPDLSQLEKIPGYERVTFDEEIITPPVMPMPDWQPDSKDQRQVTNLPTLSEEDVREAAINYASDNCCYGSAPAKDMAITNITMMSAFHYKLETFGEKRESAWRFEPYKGQPIDGPMNGPAPGPWDVVATPPELFRDGKTKIEVPHTAFVKPCHTCVGNSRVRCESCSGRGNDNCTWCKGSGKRSNFDEDPCTSCNGTGLSRCSSCSGTGQKECKTCDGKGRLKAYVQLIITWTNHVDDYISETQNMPKEKVKEVSGQVAIEEEFLRVQPIYNAPDEAVRNASTQFITKHNTAFPNERILKQRHCLRLIPIGEVSYTWKDKVGLYYVYGYEHKAYFVNYPQKCCCCTIL